MTAETRLLALLASRPALEVLAREAWARVQDEPAAASWAEAVSGLLHASAGGTCIAAVLRLRGPAARLAEAARQTTEVCLHAGASAATACVELWDRLREDGLWPGLTRLAREAPDCLGVAVREAPLIVNAVGGDGFADFVAVGLKAAGRDKARRRAFFALESPLARQALSRATGTGFAVHERQLKLFAAALWGRVPQMRPLPAPKGRPAPRRASLSDGIMLWPDKFHAVPDAAQEQLFRAATAHMVAHLMAAGPRLEVGTLKPLQLALIGLIEDARVEAQAMRRFPGLRRLWAPYHVVRPDSITVPALLARMARALFDPFYADPNGWIEKGRVLVSEADPFDPAASRRIGGLLGNDLGQMRVQFNARDYVVEPVYRDDNLGLWDFGATDAAQLESVDVVIEAARPRPEEGDGKADEMSEPEGAARARSVAPSETGVLIARYPEWDRAGGVERLDWTSVREAPARLGDAAMLENALEAAPDLRRRVERLVRAARHGRHQRLRRQPDGIDLDLDAVLDAEIARGAGELPTDRVYRGSTRQTRDLSTVVLIDASESTRAGGVLETERLAVALLAEAMRRLGDPCALMAFASSGREQVELTRIKDFSETFGVSARARLAGLSPGLSTRLGAALRHSGAELAPMRSHRRLVLVLTDGEPSDIDVQDPMDLVEDSRRAVLGLRAQGIDVFALVFGTEGAETAARMFGRAGYVALRRIEELPARLSDLYFRLSRR